MNAATMRSPRLQRVLGCLKRGGWWSTRQLIEYARVCAVNSVISELRANGYAIETETKRWRGRTIWRYRLAGGGEG